MEPLQWLDHHVQCSDFLKNICDGLNIYSDLTGYYNHPAPLNDIHGIGVVLMAGSELIRLIEKQ